MHKSPPRPSVSPEPTLVDNHSSSSHTLPSSSLQTPASPPTTSASNRIRRTSPPPPTHPSLAPVHDKDFQYEMQPLPPRPFVHTRPSSDSLTVSDAGQSVITTDTDGSFDWSEQEEEEKEAAAERRRKLSAGNAKRGRKLYLLCLKIARPVRTVMIGVLGSIVLFTPSLAFILARPDSSATIHVEYWSISLAITWAAACVTSIVIDVVPTLVLRVMLLIWGYTPEKATGKVELYLATSFWNKLFFSITWMWVAFAVAQNVLNPGGDYTIWVERVCEALFALALLVWVEKLFLRYVAIRFHEVSLADRLEENQQALKALDKLAITVSYKGRPSHSRRHSFFRSALGTPSASRPVSRAGSRSPDRMEKSHNLRSPLAAGSKHTSPTEPNHHTPLDPNEVNSALNKSNRTFKGKASAIASSLSTAVGQIALKDSDFYKTNQIGSASAARSLARRIFHNLSGDRDFLEPGDLRSYFRTTEEAEAAFKLFDKDENGDISRKEMRDAVTRIYKERRALVVSLSESASIISKLDGVLLFLVFIISVFIWLLILNPSNTVSSLVPIASLVLGLSFMFGTSARALFESLVMLLGTHPFDVGDLVCIDLNYLFVKELGLFATTFTRVDGQQVVAPNALLASAKVLHNVNRSKAMWETVSLQMSFDTPMAKVQKLKEDIQTYLNENSREWDGGLTVNIDSITNMNVLTITISFAHKGNWQDWGARWTRRTALMRHIKTLLEGLDVRYALPPQPVFMHGGGPAPWGSGPLTGNAGGDIAQPPNRALGQPTTMPT